MDLAVFKERAAREGGLDRGDADVLIAEVVRLTQEDTTHKEFTLKRVKVLAQKLDCTEGLPDDSTIYGCLGTVLGMFRHRVEVLTTDHAKALTRSKAEGRREGLEEALSLLDEADSTCSDYEETFCQGVKAIERKVAAIRQQAAQEGK